MKTITASAGKEQAYVLHLITLGHAFGYEVIAQEPDGVVTIGEIPPDAMAALESSPASSAPSSSRSSSFEPDNHQAA